MKMILVYSLQHPYLINYQGMLIFSNSLSSLQPNYPRLGLIYYKGFIILLLAIRLVLLNSGLHTSPRVISIIATVLQPPFQGVASATQSGQLSCRQCLFDRNSLFSYFQAHFKLHTAKRLAVFCTNHAVFHFIHSYIHSELFFKLSTLYKAKNVMMN